MFAANSRRARHAAIMQDLDVPSPFDLTEFAARLARQRNRPIELRPVSFAPGAPCGLWIGTADADYVFYEQARPLSTGVSSRCTSWRTCCSAIAGCQPGKASPTGWRLTYLPRSSG